MSTEEGFNRLKDCRHGRMLYNVHDMYVGRSFDLYGEFSEGETELFAQIVRPGDVVIEVGANIGAHTVWFAKRTAPKGGVIAFEPQRIVFQLLCANVALNSVPNAVTFQKACGEAEGEIVVPMLDPNATNNFGGLELGRHQQGEKVEVVRIDDLGLRGCRLLKVDVEGMELSVLKGAREMILRSKPAMYVENDRPDNSDALIQYIDSLGYDCFWHWPPLFSPNNFFKNAENVFGNIVSKNMICLPKGVGVAGAEPIKVPG
jgi:FkbM family methyltransferase